jgi:hypothetical protein
MKRLLRRMPATAGLLVSAFLLATTAAQAETIEFACQRIDVANPDTLLFQVDLAAATVSLVSGEVQYRYGVRASSITATSISWSDGSGYAAQSWQLDRLSGHLTMTTEGGKVTVEFDCHKTTGF